MSKPVHASPSPVSITARITQARMQLTPSHQQIADYVLKHPLQAATMPIDELAAAVGVSVATANRFARAIGLDGYPMLRAELVKGFEAMLAPVEKMRVSLEKPGSAHDAFLAVLDESQNNIAATRAALNNVVMAARASYASFNRQGIGRALEILQSGKFLAIDERTKREREFRSRVPSNRHEAKIRLRRLLNESFPVRVKHGNTRTDVNVRLLCLG